MPNLRLELDRQDGTTEPEIVEDYDDQVGLLIGVPFTYGGEAWVPESKTGRTLYCKLAVSP